MNESKQSVPVKKTVVNKSVSPLTLDSSNVRTYFRDESIRQILRDPKLLHKIIITNTEPSLSKNMILDAVLRHSRPNILVPMFITEENNNIQFYCTLCGPVLNVFCNQSLHLNIVINNNKVALPMTLVIAAKKRADFLRPDNFLKLLIKPRISSSLPAKINLSRFNDIIGKQNKIYLNINIDNCFNYIMYTVHSFSPIVINLSCNDLDSLQGWKYPYPLNSIDLSFNKIKEMTSFECLSKIRTGLKEINFYENPIWNEFPTKALCLKKLRQFFPNTVISNQFAQIVRATENVLNTQSAIYLIDQFLEHYLPLYENPKKRKYLHEMYHKNAIFSLNSNINEITDGFSFNTQYFKQHSHNLQSKSKQYFTIGPDEILNKLCNLPHVKHDYCNIKIDILHYIENKTATFVLTGLFCEVSSNLLYSFTRSFVIQAGQNGEYHIMNDMLNVRNYEQQFSIGYQLFQDISQHLPLPIPVSKEQQDGLVAVFIDVTTLHVEHAKNLLEKHNWNIKEALETFVHDFRFDLIPLEHF